MERQEDREIWLRIRMKRNAILDTGPIVALIDAADRDHLWSVQQWSDIEPPMLTCESVISEACFLLNQIDSGTEAVFEMLSRKAVEGRSASTITLNLSGLCSGNILTFRCPLPIRVLCAWRSGS